LIHEPSFVKIRTIELVPVVENEIPGRPAVNQTISLKFRRDLH